MSKWSVATGRIRRHATGILGGRIGGVDAAPNQPAPSVPATAAVPDADRPGSTEPTGTSGGVDLSSALTERTVNLRLPPAARRASARRPGHRVGRFLLAIDRRLLPPVGRALATLGRGAVWGRVVVTTGAVACVALTVVAVYTATRKTTPAPKPAGIHVGVSAGDDIRRYVATRRSILDRAAAADAPGDPVTSRYALVSFTTYMQPVQLTSLLAGVQAVEVFLRASPAGVVEAPARIIPDDVLNAIGAHARDLRDAVDVLEAKISQVTGQSPSEIALKASYRASVRTETEEMAAYTSACKCVFGVVVHGPLAALAALEGRTGVRVVDLIPLTPDVRQDTFTPAVPGQTIASPPPVEESQPR